MKIDDERETKEISLDTNKDESKQETLQSSSNLKPENSTSNNSFYEERS